jgi:hypothetical protein
MVREVCLLTLLLSHAVCGEYIATYRLHLKDSVAFSEELLLSKAMTKRLNVTCASYRIHDTKKADESTLNFLKRNQEKLLEILFQQRIRLRSKFNQSATHLQENTTILLSPTRFKVDFKRDFATIAL